MGGHCAATGRKWAGGGAVTIEDAVELRLKAPIDTLIANMVKGPMISNEQMDKWTVPEDYYRKPSSSYSAITKVTPITILQMNWHKENQSVAEALLLQEGQLDYAVAALCIWLMTETGKYVTNNLKLHRIKLELWPTVVKPFQDWCRQNGQIFGMGVKEIKHAFNLRKLTCLAGRSEEQADWVKEIKERCSATTPKRACRAGILSTQAYRDIRSHELERIAAEAVKAVVAKIGTMEEYWQERWWHTPSGTTSLAGKLKHVLKGVGSEQLDMQMRTNKKAAMEVLSEDEMKRWIMQEPGALGRGSTKPEPGMKRRALIAVDDRTAFVAGYASSHIEQALTFEGMVLKQDPADIRDWVNMDCGVQGWHVSNDYSNFNILHSLASLQMVSVALAKAWLKYSQKEPICIEKAAAEMWIAMSYERAYATTPEGSFRAICGLWSGHRNTARDNTMLHKVYLQCVQSVMSEWFGSDGRMTNVRICGDDEVGCYNNWAAAVLHTHVADALGFTSQLSKGMLSRNYDEFLQLIRMPASVPEYPVAATMLTFCSGNWYKDPVRDVSGTVQAVSQQAWDIVLGGLSIDKAQQLAASVLDYMMQVKDAEGKLVPLEWWAFRGNVKGSELWGGATKMQPKILITPIIKKVSKHAAEDSAKKEENVWKVLPDEERKRVIATRGSESYRNVAKNWMTNKLDKHVIGKWPKRENVEYTFSKTEERVIPNQRWRTSTKTRNAPNLQAVAVRHGIPPEMIAEYIDKILIVIDGRARSQLLEALDDQKYDIGQFNKWLPAPLRVFK
ncbi:RNA-dependent RNA polymerase [viral metagenome]|uniref:RNA-dependent RNA polymerase n=1 Tax=viral metagenome TaxID=1070528 RepID=A0A6L2ZKS5_9ZZZZ